MPRERTYCVQVRNTGEPWRTLWKGPGEAVAIEAARALAKKTRIIAVCQGPIPVHPYVRVMQGRATVLNITPASRQVIA